MDGGRKDNSLVVVGAQVRLVVDGVGRLVLSVITMGNFRGVLVLDALVGVVGSDVALSQGRIFVDNGRIVVNELGVVVDDMLRNAVLVRCHVVVSNCLVMIDRFFMVVFMEAFDKVAGFRIVVLVMNILTVVDRCLMMVSIVVDGCLVFANNGAKVVVSSIVTVVITVMDGLSKNSNNIILLSFAVAVVKSHSSMAGLIRSDIVMGQIVVLLVVIVTWCSIVSAIVAVVVTIALMSLNTGLVRSDIVVSNIVVFLLIGVVAGRVVEGLVLANSDGVMDSAMLIDCVSMSISMAIWTMMDRDTVLHLTSKEDLRESKADRVAKLIEVLVLPLGLSIHDLVVDILAIHN